MTAPERDVYTVDEFCAGSKTLDQFMPHRNAFSINEVAEWLGVDPAAVRRAVDARHLPSIMMGPRTIRILRRHLDGWKMPVPPTRKVRPPPISGLIYFIDDGFFIKIGFAKSPRDRMKTLQTASPFELKLIQSIVGNRRAEKELHRKFRHLRSYGEWFRGESELRQFILGLGKAS